MKNLILLALTSSLLALTSSLSAAEVVVYSPPSDQPLHVAIVSTNDLSTYGERVFPASYTGHRAVCDMPHASTNDTFIAWIGGDTYTPGDSFGTSINNDYPTIGLTRTSAITPRFDLWQTNATDRSVVYGDMPTPRDDAAATNAAPAKYARTRVRVMRYKVDDYPVRELGVPATVLFDRIFQQDVRAIIHEGDFLTGGQLDLDWDTLKNEVVDYAGASYAMITNMQYLVVLDDTKVGGSDNQFDKLTNMVAHPLIIERRFEVTRTVPTAVQESAICQSARPTFSWKIENEDGWASRYGTTYTAFKIRLFSGASTNSTPITETDFKRMPPADADGLYRYYWPTNIAAGTYTWQVFTINSKFTTTYNRYASNPVTFTVQD